MRARLPQGTHLPHPRIVTDDRPPRSRSVPSRRSASPLELDGVPPAAATELTVVGSVPARLPPRCSDGDGVPRSGERRRYHPSPAAHGGRSSAVRCSTWRSTSPTTSRPILRPYFTNLDGPVFALVNLPEVVKGALFARYSRSDKSLRRLFLDEFVGDLDITGDLTVDASIGLKRAEELYDRVFLEYGDDSVAQLGGVHLACEQASNLLTKVLEWGRLMAYLEQSTRYIEYDSRLGGRYRYYRRPRCSSRQLGVALRRRASTRCSRRYSDMLPQMLDWARERYPKEPGDSDFVYKQTIKAKACDAVRGILPAATLSNVGIYGTGQGYEALLLRMRAHPLPEARSYADMMLEELRKVVPSFLTRVDRPERGGAWSHYLEDTRDHTADVVHRIFADERARAPPGRDPHRLRSRGRGQGARGDLLPADAPARGPDPGARAHARRRRARRVARARTWGSARTVATSRAARSSAPTTASTCSPTTARSATCNGTACSRSSGSRCRPQHGYDVPESVEEAGVREPFDAGDGRSAALHGAMAFRFPEQASYAVSLAYRLRFVDADERARGDAPASSCAPRRRVTRRTAHVAQEMHRLIAEQAGHRAIAAAMSYADHEVYELERLAVGARRRDPSRAPRS